MTSFKGLFKNNKSNNTSSAKNKWMPSFIGSSAMVGFEDNYDSSTSGKSKQRNSVCLQGIGMSGLGLADYDSDQDSPRKKPPKRSSSSNSSNPEA